MNDKPKGDILLNPGNYKLPIPKSSVVYHYYGYIIAPDVKDAQKVFYDADGRYAIT